MVKVVDGVWNWKSFLAFPVQCGNCISGSQLVSGLGIVEASFRTQERLKMDDKAIEQLKQFQSDFVVRGIARGRRPVTCVHITQLGGKETRNGCGPQVKQNSLELEQEKEGLKDFHKTFNVSFLKKKK